MSFVIFVKDDAGKATVYGTAIGRGYADERYAELATKRIRDKYPKLEATVFQVMPTMDALRRDR